MSKDNSNNDKSFNDDELQDIMNEIESLEKEFVEEETEPAPTEQDIESQSVENIEASSTTTDEAKSEQEDEISAEPEFEDDSEVELTHENVVPMSSVSNGVARSQQAGEAGHMQFSANGAMDCELNFSVADSQAQLRVSNNELIVSMGDVEIVLGENGCEITMQGGAKFSVPVSAHQSSAKKAA